MPTCIGGAAGPCFASWAHPLVSAAARLPDSHQRHPARQHARAGVALSLRKFLPFRKMRERMAPLDDHYRAILPNFRAITFARWLFYGFDLRRKQMETGRSARLP